MNDPLSTYLHDHLAGAEFALELLKSLREHHAADEVGVLAASLHAEIEQDRATLEQLARVIDAGRSTSKEMLSWLAEKATRLKLRRDSARAFGTFESLETLTHDCRDTIFARWPNERSISMRKRKRRASAWRRLFSRPRLWRKAKRLGQGHAIGQKSAEETCSLACMRPTAGNSGGDAAGAN